MINLLPYDNKRQIRAARHNVIIVKCLIFLMAAILFLLLSCAAASSFISSTNPAPEKSLNNDSTEILSQVNSMKTDFAMAETIFGQKVSYSKIITELANALPSGVIMDSLSINETSVGGPLQLVLKATSEQKGQEIKDSFNKSAIFLNTSIVSNTSSQADSTYRYTITVKTTINKANSI